MIPEGLPGAGNIMVFDNGGGAGFGESNPFAPDGRFIVERYSSRVLEIDPVTMEKVWEYSIQGHGRFHFFSHNVSMAQRLPNGNTLITEGAAGRVFEVTVEGDIVWEYATQYLSRLSRALRLDSTAYSARGARCRAAAPERISDRTAMNRMRSAARKTQSGEPYDLR